MTRTRGDGVRRAISRREEHVDNRRKQFIRAMCKLVDGEVDHNLLMSDSHMVYTQEVSGCKTLRLRAALTMNLNETHLVMQTAPTHSSNWAKTNT